MVDVAELCKREFWNKKFNRVVATRNADKSGFLTQSDFELVINRYEKLAPTTKKKVEALSKEMLTFCDRLGLVDESIKFSYDEFGR